MSQLPVLRSAVRLKHVRILTNQVGLELLLWDSLSVLGWFGFSLLSPHDLELISNEMRKTTDQGVHSHCDTSGVSSWHLLLATALISPFGARAIGV